MAPAWLGCWLEYTTEAEDEGCAALQREVLEHYEYLFRTLVSRAKWPIMRMFGVLLVLNCVVR